MNMRERKTLAEMEERFGRPPLADVKKFDHYGKAYGVGVQMAEGVDPIVCEAWRDAFRDVSEKNRASGA